MDLEQEINYWRDAHIQLQEQVIKIQNRLIALTQQMRELQNGKDQNTDNTRHVYGNQHY